MIEFNNILPHICKNKRRKWRNMRNCQLKVPLNLIMREKLNLQPLKIGWIDQNLIFLNQNMLSMHILIKLKHKNSNVELFLMISVKT